jgi:hypothetical protein
MRRGASARCDESDLRRAVRDKPIGTAEEDRRRFERYAAAYTAAGGPQQALVDQWRKFVAR